MIGSFLHVEQGRVYEGGADVPFFVTRGAIADALAEQGYGGVVVLDRTDEQEDPSGGEAWNTYVRAMRVGPTTDEIVPAGVAWAREVAGPQQTGAAPPPAGAAPNMNRSRAIAWAVTLGALGVPVAIAAAVLALRGRKSR